MRASWGIHRPCSIQRQALGLLSALALVCGLSTKVAAQPSGGPYGPIQQRYEVPKAAAHVYYVAPDGKAESPGTALAAPTTIEAAMERVVTGDAIIMRGGVYRTGGLRLNQGITIQPYGEEHPVLKGTEVASKWESLRDNVWRTSWKKLFPSKPQNWWRRSREGMRTPLHRFNNDMVFVDGVALQSAAWEGGLDKNTYFIDYENGHVFLGQDPANHVVEITAWDSALVRTSGPCHSKESDRKGPTIRGITFTQYAYRALEVEGKRRNVGPNDEPTDDPEGVADPSSYGKEVVGTTLEDVTISHCSRVAGYFRGDKLTIRRCLVSDTSTEGIYVIGSSDVLLEKNIFRRNNVELITGYYPSAVKIFNQSYQVTCRDNLVMENPNSNGIWYDVGNVDGVFINNWVQDTQDGFFFEISKGAIVAGNVFVRCDKGIRSLNSSGVRAYNNTLVDSVASFERNGRVPAGDLFGWHSATGPDIDKREGHVFVGNLLTASPDFHKELLRAEQPQNLCEKLPKSQLTQVDGNVYVRMGERGEETLIVWGPVAGEKCVVDLKGLAELQKYQPAFETHGHVLDRVFGSVFKNPILGLYSPGRDLPATIALPEQVRLLLGWKKGAPVTPGAYQR